MSTPSSSNNVAQETEGDEQVGDLGTEVKAAQEEESTVVEDEHLQSGNGSKSGEDGTQDTEGKHTPSYLLIFLFMFGGGGWVQYCYTPCYFVASL